MGITTVQEVISTRVDYERISVRFNQKSNDNLETYIFGTSALYAASWVPQWTPADLVNTTTSMNTSLKSLFQILMDYWWMGLVQSGKTH